MGESAIAAHTRTSDFCTSRTNAIDGVRERSDECKTNATRTRANQSVIEHSIVALDGRTTSALFNRQDVHGLAHDTVVDFYDGDEL